MPEICISISKSPGNFGTTLHNAGYKALGIDYIYKALEINDLSEAIKAIKILGIKGCSVSMPFKEDVIKYLDTIDENVEGCGACNTILNENGKLKGFNTDVMSIYQLLSDINIDRSDHILILGAGGMAKAHLFTLKKLGYKNFTVAGRDLSKIKKNFGRFDVKFVDITKNTEINSSILVNATPIGMQDLVNGFDVVRPFLNRQKLIIDSVVSYEPTELIKYCEYKKINFIDGFSLSLRQATEQFKIYTGQNSPLAVMREAAQSLKK